MYTAGIEAWLKATLCVSAARRFQSAMLLFWTCCACMSHMAMSPSFVFFAYAEGAVQTSGSRSDRSSMESASELANNSSDMLAGADQGSNNSSETWGNSGAGKQNSTGNIVQDLMKQPEAAMDPHRWNKILEVHFCSLSHRVD